MKLRQYTIAPILTLIICLAFAEVILAQATKLKKKYSLDANSSNKYTLTILSKEDYDQRPHLGEEVNEDGRYPKINGTVKLPLAQGKYYVAMDSGVSDGSSDSYVTYEYLGQLLSANYYLIQVGGYETMGYTLIDKATGKENRVGRNLVVSPKATKIISCMDPLLDIMPSDDFQNLYLEVYMLSSGKITKESESISIQIYSGDRCEILPHSCLLHWENENTVLLELVYTCNGSDQSDYVSLKLK